LSKDVSIELDEDGFLKDPNKWNAEVATYIAREQFGIELEDIHLKVVRFFLEYYQKWGTLPMIRTVRTNLNLTSEKLDELFKRKNSTARGVICKISGLPKLLCMAAGC